VQAHVLTLALEQEQERAAGAWQSEWPALGEAFRCASGATAAMAAVVEGLVVDEARMRANLQAGGGVVMSESVLMALAPKLGRPAAREAVEAAAAAAAAGKTFRESLLADARVTSHLDEAELDAALDPSGYLGAADALVDTALKQYRAVRSGHERER
jgi:3-carboxy-cis,cis-muconate cycloisomerase